MHATTATPDPGLRVRVIAPTRATSSRIAYGRPSRVWGYDFGAESNSLGVYIGYLRRKTEEGGEPRLIHTVRRVGYVVRGPA